MSQLHIYKTDDWRFAKEITNTCACLTADRSYIIQNAVCPVEKVDGAGLHFGRPSQHEPWVPLVVYSTAQQWRAHSKVTDLPGWQFGMACPPWDHVIWEPCTYEPGMDLTNLWVGLVDSACCNTEWYPATAKDIDLGSTQLRRVTGGARLVKWQQLFTRDGMKQGNAIVVHVDDTGDRPMYDIVTDFGNVCHRMSIDKAADHWYFHRRGEFVIDPEYPRAHVEAVNRVRSKISLPAATEYAPATKRTAAEIVMYVLEAYDVDPKTVARDTPIIALPLDSLDMIMIISALEDDVLEEYGSAIEISDADAESWTTVGDVMAYVERACADFV